MKEDNTIYFREEYAQISFSSSKSYMDVIWKAPITDVAHYKLTLSKALVVLKQYDVKNWITDISLKSSVTSDEKDWIIKYLLPNVKDTSLEKLAFIVNKDTFNGEESETFQKQIEEQGICTKLFHKKDDAYEWIGTLCASAE